MGSQDSETDSTWTEYSLAIVQRILNDIWTSPINLTLVILIIFLVVKLFLLKRKPEYHSPTPVKPIIQLPKMAKCDMTLDQLRGYNGIESDGRILTAIYGDIFDVSRRSDLYGSGRK